MRPELRRALVAGDVDAVVRLHESLCLWVARDYFAPGHTFDDLVQEARIGVAEAVRDWRPEAGASFNSFAKLCAQRKVLTLVRLSHAQKHRPVTEAESMDAPHTEEGGTLADIVPCGQLGPVERVLLRERLGEVLERFERLSDVEREVLLAWVFEGRGYDEIAAGLGRGRKSVDNAMQRARHKLEAA